MKSFYGLCVARRRVRCRRCHLPASCCPQSPHCPSRPSPCSLRIRTQGPRCIMQTAQSSATPSRLKLAHTHVHSIHRPRHRSPTPAPSPSLPADPESRFPSFSGPTWTHNAAFILTLPPIADGGLARVRRADQVTPHPSPSIRLRCFVASFPSWLSFHRGAEAWCRSLSCAREESDFGTVWTWTWGGVDIDTGRCRGCVVGRTRGGRVLLQRTSVLGLGVMGAF